MLNLKRLPTGVALLNWNSELPSSGTGDPLGMTLRVGARLGAELLHCITSITPRARYYSFFPWAFQRAQDRTRGKGDFDQLMQFVLIDERAMTLGAVLHHDGNPCEGGSLQGSNRAVDLAANSSKRSIDLGQWSHLRDNTSGFAAYKGSLINLGIFAESASPDTADDEDENDQSNNLTSGELSAKGRKLATAFGQAVAGTEFVKMRPAGGSMDLDVLKEFGASAGLCELRAAEEFDLLPLRDLFFSTDSDSHLNSHYRRRMSLLLLLWATLVTADAGVELDERSFGDLAYYRMIFDEEDEAVSVELLPSLIDISERWRIFQFHNYLTIALESLLASFVRAILNYPAGRSVADVIEAFDNVEAAEVLGELFGVEFSVPFLDLTPAASLALLAIDVPGQTSGVAGSSEIFASNPFVERFLRDALIEQDLVSGAAGAAVAAMLLYCLMLRYDLTVADAHKGWNAQKVFDPSADVAMPTVARMLALDFEDWRNTPNREILYRVVSRFVVRQHETMSYEKGFGGSPPLFRVDGPMVVGTGLTRDDVDSGNPRFPSAMQVLRDLRLIDRDPEKGQCLTPDGQEMLNFLLEDVVS
ncbi:MULTISPECIES: hypothetical protein [unclassified Sphingobium]|uniref:hypothetical protein n=1 Tax=unclassified Sphingobium TaxID=2611147 RepID=UPI0035A5F5E8